MKWEDDYQFTKRFAGILHHGQRYGTGPYTDHLQQVEEVLKRFGFEEDDELLMSAWLHDIIEDTDISYDKIRHAYGDIIGDIVYAVTNELGRNRKERALKTYPKIRANKRAIILKLADRIANIEFSKGVNSDFINMYKREMPDFKMALYDTKEKDSRVIIMWNHLETLFMEGQNE